MNTEPNLFNVKKNVTFFVWKCSIILRKRLHFQNKFMQSLQEMSPLLSEFSTILCLKSVFRIRIRFNLVIKRSKKSSKIMENIHKIIASGSKIKRIRNIAWNSKMFPTVVSDVIRLRGNISIPGTGTILSVPKQLAG